MIFIIFKKKEQYEEEQAFLKAEIEKRKPKPKKFGHEFKDIFTDSDDEEEIFE
jgi:hypothetical protein